MTLRLGPPPLAIEGRVVGAQGEPLAGVHVWARELTPFGVEVETIGRANLRRELFVELLAGGEREVLTDGEGRFRLGGLLPRRYALCALDPRSLRFAELDGVRAGTSAATIGMRAEPSSSRVAGRLLRSDGEPLAGVPLTLVPPGPESHPEPARIHVARTDGAGRFEVASVVAEGAVLRACSQELTHEHRFALDDHPDLEALELVAPTMCEFRVELDGSLSAADRLRVLDVDGEPAPALRELRRLPHQPRRGPPVRRTFERAPGARSGPHARVVGRRVRTLPLAAPTVAGADHRRPTLNRRGTEMHALALLLLALPQDPGRLFHALREHDAQGELAALVALEGMEAELHEAERDVWSDMLATRLTFVGDARRAMEIDSTLYGGRAARRAPALDAFTPRPAVEAIVEWARDREVVMLNEEHRRNQQRAFAHELLAPLAEAGFTHLALETLTHRGVEELAERGYPRLHDGFYTRDPLLADLVRRALELGMEIVAYEAETGAMPPELASDPLASTNWREEQQARNLTELLESEPLSRVVVWCGRHHLSEAPLVEGGAGWMPMAGILTELSGIDPLTVDLMVMNEADVPEREGDVYRGAVEAGLVPAPTVFVDEAGAPYSAIGNIDAMVFLPRTREERGRPHWMALGGSREPVELPLDDDTPAPGADRPFLLQARIAGEDEAAIPLDQVLWREGPAPVLYLRPGFEYELRLLAPPAEELLLRRIDLRGDR